MQREVKSFGIGRVHHVKYYTMCVSGNGVSLRGSISGFLFCFFSRGLALNNEKVHPSVDIKDFVDPLSFFGAS